MATETSVLAQYDQAVNEATTIRDRFRTLADEFTRLAETADRNLASLTESRDGYIASIAPRELRRPVFDRPEPTPEGDVA